MNEINVGMAIDSLTQECKEGIIRNIIFYLRFEQKFYARPC